MDHDTFQATEVDALFDELDEGASASMSEHAASCVPCGERLGALRSTRARALSVLSEPVPEDLESRIMAAVDAALAKRAGGAGGAGGESKAGAAAASTAGAPEGAAKLAALFSRPAFAVAATFVLVLGGAAVLLQAGARKSAPVASADFDQVPMASGAVAMTPEPAATSTGALAAAVAAAAPPAAMPPSAAASAVAMAESADDPSAPAQAGALAPSPPPRAMGGAMAKVGSVPAAAEPPPPDPRFASAMSLFEAGRYAEALPRFEALKATTPEADLYAARCVAKTRGCAAAAPRFDAAAASNAGTEAGSRARLEGGQCYQSIGQAQAARSRYQAAQSEGLLASEATRDLAALDGKPAAPAEAAKPGTPGAAGRPASPKAAPAATSGR
jgi:hypothetical protein